MKSKRRKLAFILFPFSFLYGIIVSFRNFLFNKGILKSTQFPFPVVSVGNITVGGTGKTPHTEYIISILKEKWNIATLSRGYKRKTNKFQFVSTTSTVAEVGDEPRQMKQKFPNIIVAVDNDRVNGIKEIKSKHPKIDIVILDDAFQHRKVKAGLNILLTDFNRPMFSDSLLPIGDLRENIKSMKRADIVIITKTPENYKPIEQRLFLQNYQILEHQFAFFTKYEYKEIVNIFSKKKYSLSTLSNKPIIAVTGIASAEPFINKISEFSNKIQHFEFPDHHNFSTSDFKKIETAVQKIADEKPYLITTEKDATRIKEMTNLSNLLKENFFFIPVEVAFFNSKDETFFVNLLQKFALQDRKISSIYLN